MRWSYKTVHYEMKKEGLLGSAFLDESEIEQSLNEYGKAGWELVSMLETLDGLIAVFKQPLTLESRTVARPDHGTHQQPVAPKPVPSRMETKVEPRRFEEKKPKVEVDEEIVLVDDYEDEREGPAVQVKKKPVPPDSSDVGSIRIE